MTLTRVLSSSMSRLPSRLASTACMLAAAAWLVGCAARTHRAPVEERTPTPVGNAASPVTAVTVTGPAAIPSAAPAAGTAPAAAPEAGQSKPPPGAENAGLPGYYSVKPGDTLVRIGLDSGQNWRDIARWNNIDNPNVLEVGQVLRVIPPAGDAGGPATTRPVAPAPRIESRPLDARPPGPASALPSASGPAPSAAPSVAPAPTSPPASSPAAGPSAAAGAAAAPSSLPPGPLVANPGAAARDADGDINWAWPASGPVTAAFDEVRSKGLAIAGKAGDPVLAAADGRVVYAGSGLRGYGNLVIVKHNATYLTAYAHNQALLVKEDQPVRRGQKIAEMGSSDTDRVQLHFEVRRQGKPVDPAKVLPAR